MRIFGLMIQTIKADQERQCDAFDLGMECGISDERTHWRRLRDQLRSGLGGSPPPGAEPRPERPRHLRLLPPTS